MPLIRPPTLIKNQNFTVALANQYWRDNLNLLHRAGAYQTADVVKNSDATLANLTGLSFPVVSGDVWVYGAHVFYKSSAAADIQLAVDAPVGSTGRYGVVGGAQAVGDASTTTFGTGLTIGVPGTNEDNHMIWGHVTAGANGSVQIQGAQGTSTAVDTTFRLYSPIIAFRLSSTAGTSPIPTFATNQVIDAADIGTWLKDALNNLSLRRRRLVEEITANNTTMQVLTGMEWTVREGEKWIFHAPIFFSSNSTARVAFAVEWPHDTDGRYGVTGYGQPIAQGSTGTSDDPVAISISSSAETMAMVNGFLIAGRDGKVRFKGAQETASGSNIFHQGSHVQAWRIAA